MSDGIRKAADFEIALVDGVPCVIVSADDASRLAIPVGAFSRMNDDVLRFQASRALGSFKDRLVSGHLAVSLRPATEFDLGTMPTGTGDVVALLVDKGTDHEIGLSIQPATARELGQRLIEEADRSSSRPTSRN